MKPFLLFAFDSYYPTGGWDDHVGSYATREEAIAAALKIAGTDHIQLVDLNTDEVTELR